MYFINQNNNSDMEKSNQNNTEINSNNSTFINLNIDNPKIKFTEEQINQFKKNDFQNFSNLLYGIDINTFLDAIINDNKSEFETLFNNQIQKEFTFKNQKLMLLLLIFVIKLVKNNSSKSENNAEQNKNKENNFIFGKFKLDLHLHKDFHNNVQVYKYVEPSKIINEYYFKCIDDECGSSAIFNSVTKKFKIFGKHILHNNNFDEIKEYIKIFVKKVECQEAQFYTDGEYYKVEYY